MVSPSFPSSPSSPSPAVPASRAAARILRAIRWYQRGMEGRPSPCRFFPSCSSYAYEAVEVHGGARGTWLAVRRLVRCRPFGPSGFDPVPEPAAGDPAATEPAVAGSMVAAPNLSVRGTGASTVPPDPPPPTG